MLDSYFELSTRGFEFVCKSFFAVLDGAASFIRSIPDALCTVVAVTVCFPCFIIGAFHYVLSNGRDDI